MATSADSGASIAGAGTEYGDALATRRQLYGPNTSLSYEQPLMIVRGHGTYLYDEGGVPYLDCVNNVSHLGHGNAEVASAVCAQLHTLNTNSRYLHPHLPTYAQQLLKSLNASAAPDANASCCSGSGSGGRLTAAAAQPPPPPHPASQGPAIPSEGPSLDVLYLVCSGSEANDLALRIIAAARGPAATHIAVMGGAYHGHTSALIALSPYKFWGSGGAGRQPHVHVVPCPDPYRGENLDGRAAARAVLAAAVRAGGRLGGFFCESVLSCGGQVVLPRGYLRDLYSELRSWGVVLVADEVQCGFGRLGAAFWGFQTQEGVRPDIVTMGKPIGNGYPLAALATSRELAGAFAAPGMEYFNTYGGSTAAVAAGLAVLRVLQRDGLQQHAERVGEYLLSGLRALREVHSDVVGDVRGLGLFLGVEVVRDKESRRHAPATARWIKERMKARRVLLSTDGPYDNVIKIKPPLVFGFREADVLLQQLGEVLRRELTPDVRQRLSQREDELWAAVYGPRHAKYRENERLLYGSSDLPRARL
ncbi:hypothetical protein PLESTB_000604100 [Pleodorina starrii]|uniref:Uncharacterized protein n=1 Tax=Pleodorina starrii TaxID=330485 RepID=A0A9W6F1K8_9CHLO|nr:hypothetical protein PLESTM_000425400 [Pleodorina starrii]GLC52276.1 hypothetical protein PLESTB_000604100 [Pleodorina starrii]